MKGYTLVYYMFQLEDCMELNICRIKSDPDLTDLKVKDVIKAFPFDALSGEYHFRFKSEFKEGGDNVVGWIDIINLNSRAPIFNNSIYVKILKLKSAQLNKILTAQKLQKIRDTTPVKTTPPSVSLQPAKPTRPLKVSQESTDLIGQDVSFGPLTSPIKTQQPINASTSAKPNTKFIIQPLNTNVKAPGLTTDGKTKVQEMTPEEKIEQARQIWSSTEKLQEAQKLAAIQFDQKIQKWAYTMKARNNFRTLLVTVHDIWEFGKWEPVDLGKLLTDNQLKKFYNKAMIAFHPDRNRNTTSRQLYMAKRIFSQLNAAFAEEYEQK